MAIRDMIRAALGGLASLLRDEGRQKHHFDHEAFRIQGMLDAQLADVDAMTGDEFEEYVAFLLELLGYSAYVTQRSRDGGADVIAEKGGQRISVQTKRYSKAVGISAVQEATSSMFRYQCSSCMVVTNNTFTRDAIEQAAHSPCIMIDREGLADMISRAKAQLLGTLS